MVNLVGSKAYLVNPIIECREMSVPANHVRCIVDEAIAAEVKTKGSDNVELEKLMAMTRREDTPIVISGLVELRKYDEYRGFRYIAVLHYLEQVGEFIRLRSINSTRWSKREIASIDEFLALDTDGLGVSYGFGIAGEVAVLPWNTDDAIILEGMKRSHPRPFTIFDNKHSGECERFQALLQRLGKE